jgi:hypothetical protein
MARTLVREIRDTRKNYLINGDMRISQRHNSFPSIGNNAYSLDRFVYTKSGAMAHTVSQGTDVPTFAQANYLFQNSLVMTLTTPDTSITGAEGTQIEQRVEGYNWANIAQRSFTLSFWVKATLAGTYCVAFRNSGPDRSYVAEYTINSSNTWEYKTVTVSASPSAGTWNYTTGVGLTVTWTLAAGPSIQTTPGTWQTGNFVATSNQVNGVNTGATSFLLTGVMLNEGTVAAPFSLFGEDFEGEVAACQRYFEKSYALTQPIAQSGTGHGGAAQFGAGTSTHRDSWVRYATRKRVAATARFFSPDTGAEGVVRNRSTNADVGIAAGEQGETGFNGSFSATAGQHYSYHWVGECEL